MILKGVLRVVKIFGEVIKDNNNNKNNFNNKINNHNNNNNKKTSWGLAVPSSAKLKAS